MIVVDGLTFTHPQRLPLFHNFSWRVEKGQFWTVIGPSGSGKTTLLYLLAGLVSPQAGQISIDGQHILRPRPSTGLILQDYGLLPWATVLQNACLGLQMRNFYGPDGLHAPIGVKQADGHAVDIWLARLGLAEYAASYPQQISGGQRQRTAIARTLALSPDLLLMDEPFSSLDAPTREGLQELMLELWQEQHFTMVTVTHAIEEAVLLGEYILFLGVPPHCAAQVVPNPGGGKACFRATPVYQAMCGQLREMLSSAVKGEVKG